MPTNAAVTRRHLMQGAASLPLAAVLADPAKARAAAETLETVATQTADGRTVSAALARPEGRENAPGIILIHEWWGLNDQIKAVARDIADQGAVALAIDLYNGKVAETRDDAGRLARSVETDKGLETTTAWATWLRKDGQTSDKLATMGWCFGGGWSLNASVATPVDATIIYYGRVTKSAQELASLKGPVLGHFATQDRFINEEMVSGFKAAMAQAGKPLTVHWYEADHAFANPTSARYDAPDAALAWERTTAFLKETVGF